MQTITLIALGKLNADYYAKAAAEYAKRLSAYCRLNIVELPEEPIAEKNASPAVIGKALEKEARARSWPRIWTSARAAARGTWRS